MTIRDGFHFQKPRIQGTHPPTQPKQWEWLCGAFICLVLLFLLVQYAFGVVRDFPQIVDSARAVIR